MRQVFKPLGDRVLVKRDEASELTDSGLVKGAIEAPRTGVVVAISADWWQAEDELGEKQALRVGARVAFGHYSGAPIELNKEEFLILRTDELTGVIEEVEG